jgi:hypothetical protein
MGISLNEAAANVVDGDFGAPPEGIVFEQQPRIFGTDIETVGAIASFREFLQTFRDESAAVPGEAAVSAAADADGVVSRDALETIASRAGDAVVAAADGDERRPRPAPLYPVLLEHMALTQVAQLRVHRDVA